jgi:hypothetical protein
MLGRNREDSSEEISAIGEALATLVKGLSYSLDSVPIAKNIFGAIDFIISSVKVSSIPSNALTGIHFD